ncbi:cytidylyltransferase domain-containing protein [Candidatus Synechococcus calcipolaris]
MKILAVIPARGGSKRLPRKNIRILGDKSLITLEYRYFKRNYGNL